jgi:hypothetical protein
MTKTGFWLYFLPASLIASLWISSAYPIDPRVAEALAQSSFYSNTRPASVTPDSAVSYDAMLMSVLASTKSRLPERDETRWQAISLPAVHKEAFCPGPMKGYLKRSATNSPYTFIILPGSYATYTRGSYINQTTDVLSVEFNDPNIITFPGYLSPDFLSGTCVKIPWDHRTISKDLFERLSQELQSIRATPATTGLIGFSGGATLAADILAADAIATKAGSTRRFGLGAMSFSPILDGRTAFANLDTRHKNSRINPNLGLTTMDPNNLWYLLMHGEPDWQDVLALYSQSPIEFDDRSFNEFTIEDLYSTVSSVGIGAGFLQRRGLLTYYDVYVYEGFQKDTKVSDADVDAAFDRATDLRPTFAAVDRPLLIYFSQDDPVLSNSESADQPAVISDILSAAKTNPNVTVFNPKYSGHTGALMDAAFSKLVFAFFSASAPRPPQP